jgi:recombination protein U
MEKPTKKSSKSKSKTAHANRGKSFEKLIEDTNTSYEFEGLGMVQKIPNEWIVQRRGPQIINAFTRSKSTVDFIGIIRTGQGISFEAKQTANKTSFPLSNIKPHQIDYLTNFEKMKGIAFFLVNFSTFGRTFILPVTQLNDFMQNNDKKSIPFSYFEDNTIEVYRTDTKPIDYLSPILKSL